MSQADGGTREVGSGEDGSEAKPVRRAAASEIDASAAGSDASAAGSDASVGTMAQTDAGMTGMTAMTDLPVAGSDAAMPDAAGAAGATSVEAGAGAPAPACTVSPETCDGSDNDCDEKVDEDPGDCASPSICSAGRCVACEDGRMEMCDGPRVGACNPGVRLCQAGTWSSCMGVSASSDEVCDNVDNDCDGEVDDDPSDCTSPKICSAGRCRDCQDGATEPCPGDSMGVCNPGTKRCTNGRWSSCMDVVSPAMEVCDNLDNDCNDRVDDNPVDCRSPNRCNAGRCDECTGNQSEACPGNNTGECRSGTRSCGGGRWSACSGERRPEDERCDGKDNDCDTVVDEEQDSCPAGSVCQRGECVMKCGDGEVQADEECDWSVSGWAGLCDAATCTRNYYGSCDTVGAACMQNGVCGEFLNSGGVRIRQCGLSCQSDSQCPPLPGTQQAECNFAACVLLCDNGRCPNMMTCSRSVQIYDPLDGSFRHTADICIED